MSEDEGTDGRVLADRYRLTGVLGKGGMGTVWRATDETLGRTVAVKELRFPGNVDEEEKKRLITRTLREAKATARIRNSGAITVYDVVEEDDRPWIVMELVEGRSLSDAIREDGPLTPKRAAEVGLVVLDVLKAAHKEGILHRDVKPSNVLLADDSRVVLSDFGIAQIDGDPSVTSTGMLVGAPSYISPERARGQKPGPPADLWSLGALLFASVEGRPPYDKGSAIATLTAVMTEPVGPMDNAGPLAEVIRGLLAKDPERRLDNAGATALLTAVANAPERPVAPPAPADDSRTVVLPVDPQPTPTDAPAETRAAAEDQARVRDALRSVRSASVAPAPDAVAEPGASKDRPATAGGPLSDALRRRTVTIVLAALVLALLGTVIGVAIARSGDDKDDSKNGAPHSSTAPTTPVATPATRASAAAPATSQPTAPSSAPTAPTTPPSSAASTATAGAPATNAAVPAGWHTTSVPGLKFSLALPPGWKQTGTTPGGAGVIFSANGGYPRVQVDFTGEPGKDAAANWRAAEPGIRSTSRGYHRISIASVDYRGYRTAADWLFLRTEKDGTKARVQDRGFVVDDSHGYAIMFSAADDQWDSAATRALHDGFYASFQPAR